jgi:hypothetical protein
MLKRVGLSGRTSALHAQGSDSNPSTIKKKSWSFDEEIETEKIVKTCPKLQIPTL